MKDNVNILTTIANRIVKGIIFIAKGKSKKKMMTKIILALLEKRKFRENMQLASGGIQKRRRARYGHERTC